MKDLRFRECVPACNAPVFYGSIEQLPFLCTTIKTQLDMQHGATFIKTTLLPARHYQVGGLTIGKIKDARRMGWWIFLGHYVELRVACNYVMWSFL